MILGSLPWYIFPSISILMEYETTAGALMYQIGLFYEQRDTDYFLVDVAAKRLYKQCIHPLFLHPDFAFSNVLSRS
ncbi:unnamed protein product [Gongylonema pulchrum]|uniref:Protein kinase domain-containing protein n=1 Tax=Gongylonema pulchrum TaxID=637853 RepID=A0A183DLI5_9BILA|nr:unnamed protein product [Gongylonema pulchrum]